MDEQRQYAEWYYRQSRQKRRELKAKGLHPDKYDTPLGSCRSLDRLTETHGTPDCDPLLSVDDPALIAFLNDQRADDQSDIPRPQFIALIRFVNRAYLTTTDKAVIAHVLSVQSALGLLTEPQSEAARRMGMTTAAFNWRVRKLQRTMGLPSHRNEHHRAKQAIGVSRAWASRNKKQPPKSH